MDIGDINKVASRKRLNVDAEKLREKVSRETANIIKLKVAQDTAYWDLKEKLQQVEGNHERLQQNMVEVQMQHEAISGQYQDELRLRPETLNKMSSTREICDVLEEYCERLKETLSRCKSDQATLCEAYQRSGQLVRDIKLQQLQADEQNKQHVERLEEKGKYNSSKIRRLTETLCLCQSQQTTLCEACQKSTRLVQDINLQRLQGDQQNKQHVGRLEIGDYISSKYNRLLMETQLNSKSDQPTPYETYCKRQLDIKQKNLQSDKQSNLMDKLEEKVKLTSEHQSQLLQYFTAAKQQTDTELADARQKLSTASAQKDELIAVVNELRRKVDLDQHEMQKKEESISSLQKDMKQLLHEFNLQASDMKNTILKQDKELKDASESTEAFKKALCNQETFTKSICDQNNQLQEKISSFEDENICAKNVIKDLETKLQATITANDEYKKLVAILSEKKEELDGALAVKVELVEKLEAEIQVFQQQLLATEAEKTQLTSHLTACKEVCSTNTARVQELDTLVENLQAKTTELEKELEELKESSAQQVSSLSALVQQKDKELDVKAGTIAQLMTELKDGTDARARLEAAALRLRLDLEADAGAARDRERAARKLADQLDLANRSKDEEIAKQISIIFEIRSEKDRLQDKIQSMQTTIDNIQHELTAAPAPRHPPDHDDNANMSAPSKDLSQSPKLPVKFAVPRKEPNQVDLFTIFSDGSSMDGDTLDPTEVNRRFEALSRGERAAPLGLAALRRRAQGGLRHKDRDVDDPISLSQMKNEMKKDKTFFKSKRGDAKNKKVK